MHVYLKVSPPRYSPVSSIEYTLVGQPDRWSSIISRYKTGGGTDVQDRDRLELDRVMEMKNHG